MALLRHPTSQTVLTNSLMLITREVLVLPRDASTVLLNRKKGDSEALRS